MSSYNNFGLGNSSSKNNSSTTMIVVACVCCCCSLAALLWYAYTYPDKIPWLAGLIGRKSTEPPTVTYGPSSSDEPMDTWPPLGTGTPNPSGTPDPSGTPSTSGTPDPSGTPFGTWDPIFTWGPSTTRPVTIKPLPKPHVCAPRPGCVSVKSSAPTPFCKQGAVCYRCKAGVWGKVHPKWCVAKGAVEKYEAFAPEAPLPFNGP